jgi:hypothetical protein
MISPFMLGFLVFLLVFLSTALFITLKFDLSDEVLALISIAVALILASFIMLIQIMKKMGL